MKDNHEKDKAVAHTSFSSLLVTPHFRKHLIFNVVVCVVLNFFIDQYQGQAKLDALQEKWRVASGGSGNSGADMARADLPPSLPIANHPDVVIEVIFFCVISSALYVLASGALRKDVVEGKSMPVLGKCYRDALWKRYLWFSVAATNGTLRGFLLMLQSVVFTACPLYLLLGFCTDQLLEGQTFTDDATYKALFWVAPYKALGAAWLCTCNYVAAHNISHPEFKELLAKQDAEEAAAAAAAKKKKAE